MRESIVHLEIALMLRKVDFFESTEYWYAWFQEWVPISEQQHANRSLNEAADHDLRRPTYGLLSKWIRENHKLHVFVDIDPDIFAGKLNYYPQIKDLSCDREGLQLITKADRFQDHDQALEKGLQLALTIIIKRNAKKN